jgi:hypothetical protein
MLCLLLSTGQEAYAQATSTGGPTGQLLLQTSLWTTHYNKEPHHNDQQDLFGFEWTFRPRAEGSANEFPEAGTDRLHRSWLGGAATFRNSFHQRTYYVYGGRRFDLSAPGNTRAYMKLTGGLMHGYRDRYQNKIPFNNRHSTAPVVLPAFGIDHGRFNLEIVPFGIAGMMLTAGFYWF